MQNTVSQDLVMSSTRLTINDSEKLVTMIMWVTGAKAGGRCRERGRSEVVASRRFLLHCFKGS